MFAGSPYRNMETSERLTTMEAVTAVSTQDSIVTSSQDSSLTSLAAAAQILPANGTPGKTNTYIFLYIFLDVARPV